MNIYTEKLDNKTAKLFIRNFKTLAEIFGEERVVKIAEDFKISDFAEKSYVELDNTGMQNYYNNLGYIVTNPKTNHLFTEYKEDRTGVWERHVSKSAIEYLTPDNYQLKEKYLIIKLLLDVHPELVNLDIKAYHCDNLNSEVYISCENDKLLYCPLVALVTNDFDAIEDRHRSYMHSYYGNTKERAEKYLPDELATLETETAVKLKTLLDSKKTK